MECYHSSRSRRLSEGYVGNRATPTQHANPSLAAAGELSYALCDVGSTGDFHDVASECVWTVSGYEDGRFGFVFGSGWSASWSPVPNLDCSFFRFVALLSIVFFVGSTPSAATPAAAAFVDREVMFVENR